MKIVKIARFLIVLIFVTVSLFAQPGRKQILEGNKLYQEQKFDEANNKYRDALVNNPGNPIINFNIGNVEYKKKKYEEALKNFEKTLSIDEVLTQSKAYYNMGNALYRAGKLPESILAYTQALRLNPNDEDAKYNLEFVRAQLKNQAQQQQGENQQQQQGQNQQQQQPEEDQEQGNKEQQDQSEELQSEENQQQQQQAEEKEPQEMTKEEAERILEALKEDEKDLQKQRKSTKSGQVRIVKDW